MFGFHGNFQLSGQPMLIFLLIRFCVAGDFQHHNAADDEPSGVGDRVIGNPRGEDKLHSGKGRKNQLIWFHVVFVIVLLRLRLSGRHSFVSGSSLLPS